MDNYGFLFHHQHLQSSASNLNLKGFPRDLDGLNMVRFSKNSRPLEGLETGRDISLPLSGEPNDSQSSKPLNLGTDLAPAYSPLAEFLIKDKYSAGTFDFGQKENHVIGAQMDRKKFLVFDQSGGKTNLVCSSLGETFVQVGTFLKIPSFYHSFEELSKTGVHPQQPILINKHVEDELLESKEDEMCEDTEELNALLCSDSEDDLSEDDETSTGHSPSVMTSNNEKNVDEETDEVYNFSCQTKKRKLFDGRCDELLQRKSKNHHRTYPSSTLEDDTESTCSNKQSRQELGFSTNDKRNEQILKAVGILGTIFPSLKSKNAINVIDEAVHCLKSLKFKIEEFGLDAL